MVKKLVAIILLSTIVAIYTINKIENEVRKIEVVNIR